MAIASWRSCLRPFAPKVRCDATSLTKRRDSVRRVPTLRAIPSWTSQMRREVQVASECLSAARDLVRFSQPRSSDTTYLIAASSTPTRSELQWLVCFIARIALDNGCEGHFGNTLLNPVYGRYQADSARHVPARGATSSARWESPAEAGASSNNACSPVPFDANHIPWVHRSLRPLEVKTGVRLRGTSSNSHPPNQSIRSRSRLRVAAQVCHGRLNHTGRYPPSSPSPVEHATGGPALKYTTVKGLRLYHVGDYEWQTRDRSSGWSSKTGVYLRDETAGLVLRLAEWPVGATEPVHTHPGTHATTVLSGRVLADGVELAPLGIILGYGNQPHGPLEFPDGAFILSALQDDQGGHVHTAVDDSGIVPDNCAIPTDGIPWQPHAEGFESKTLIDGVLDRLTISALRFPPGSSFGQAPPTGFRAMMIFEGSAVIEKERLSVWDLISFDPGVEHSLVEFPQGATLIVWTMP